MSARQVRIGCVALVLLVIIAIGIATSIGRPGDGPGASIGQRAERAATTNPAGYRAKATFNETAALRRVGAWPDDHQQLYHRGLDHIRNAHGNPGSFTIQQVINDERDRESQRERQRAAQATRIAEAVAAKERVQARQEEAAAARRAAEEANLTRGTPDCLVLDNRTLTTESGEYSWYIVGKVINHCDRDLRYVAVEFKFFDSAGNVQDTGLTNMNNLGAGETWSFRKGVYEHTTGGGKWRVEKLEGF